jgi:hypothetical protein
MYLIIQQRWIRGSKLNGEWLIDSSARKREAKGLVKHHFHSAMEMMIKHDYPAEDFHIDEENHSITLADEEGLWYHTRFYMKEK